MPKGKSELHIREVRTTYLPVENFCFVKSELHIFGHRVVRTTYFVKSELHIGEKREVKATYFVKSKLYIVATR